MSNKPVLLSVITAVLNAEQQLPRLIESLQSQSDRDFEWIVADGGSTDSTFDLLSAVTGLNIKISSNPDFGIYDSLNRAIKECSGEYYLVCGADDVLFENAIFHYKNEILLSDADIVTAKIMINDNVIEAGRYGWLYGMSEHISSHSVGSVFRKSLHDKYGYYSKLYPICSDKLFVGQAIIAGASLRKSGFVAGIYSGGGTSSTYIAETLCENFCIQLALGRNRIVQMLLLYLRLIKNFMRI